MGKIQPATPLGKFQGAAITAVRATRGAVRSRQKDFLNEAQRRRAAALAHEETATGQIEDSAPADRSRRARNPLTKARRAKDGEERMQRKRTGWKSPPSTFRTTAYHCYRVKFHDPVSTKPLAKVFAVRTRLCSRSTRQLGFTTRALIRAAALTLLSEIYRSEHLRSEGSRGLWHTRLAQGLIEGGRKLARGLASLEPVEEKGRSVFVDMSLLQDGTVHVRNAHLARPVTKHLQSPHVFVLGGFPNPNGILGEGGFWWR